MFSLISSNSLGDVGLQIARDQRRDEHDLSQDHDRHGKEELVTFTFTVANRISKSSLSSPEKRNRHIFLLHLRGAAGIISKLNKKNLPDYCVFGKTGS